MGTILPFTGESDIMSSNIKLKLIITWRFFSWVQKLSLISICRDNYTDVSNMSPWHSCTNFELWSCMLPIWSTKLSLLSKSCSHISPLNSLFWCSCLIYRNKYFYLGKHFKITWDSYVHKDKLFNCDMCEKILTITLMIIWGASMIKVRTTVANVKKHLRTPVNMLGELMNDLGGL